MAVGIRPCTTVVAGNAIFGNQSLLCAAAAYLEALLAEGGAPVVVTLGDLSPAHEVLRQSFVDRMVAQGSKVRAVPASAVEQIRGISEPCVYLVHPDLVASTLTDFEAIGIAARLACQVIFLTRDGAVETAESPLIEGGDVLEHLNFEEMLEVAHGTQGCAVSPQATQHAWLTNTPFKIYSLDTGRWTTVTHDTYEKRMRAVASVTVTRELSYVVACREPSAALGAAPVRVALGTLARQGIRIEQLRTLRNGLTFACDTRQAEAALFHLQRSHFVGTTEPCVRLSAIGSGLQSSPGVIHAMLESLEGADVVPLHLSDSSVTVSILVREADAARAEHALRRTFLSGERPGTPALGHIAFDATTRTLRVRDRSEKLGQRQAKLLHLLMQNVGKAVDIESAAQVLFGKVEPASLAAVRVHIHNIRKKIEDDPVDPKYILTVPNRGYTFARHLSMTLEAPHRDHTSQSLGTSQAS